MAKDLISCKNYRFKLFSEYVVANRNNYTVKIELGNDIKIH